jgi:hypothetical protein
MKRYIYKQEPITIKEAKSERRRHINYVKKLIYEMKQELALIKSNPLPTTKTTEITLNPGDDGYENAPIGFHKSEWQEDYLEEYRETHSART